MLAFFAARKTRGSVPIWPVAAPAFGRWRAAQGKAVRDWLDQAGFAPKPGASIRLPAQPRGALAHGGILVVTGETPDLWALAALPPTQPRGTYHLEGVSDADAATAMAAGWGLASYRFARYRAAAEPAARLVFPEGCDRAQATRLVEATALVRDLINTPAADMGPPDLAGAAEHLARAYDAKCRIVSGKALETGFPAIHAVGQAAARGPRLVDLRWGRAGAPRVTLVGKGVCFDTGGLDLKTSQGMRLMKKDMGGAATVLGLARLVMDANLPVRLRVLIPAVENSVAGNAYRPGDVVRTRKGLTVEIGNTDAEGRVVLADALALADEEEPDLLIDCATLTGAARVALGTELPALFTGDDAFAADLLAHGAAAADPLWRMPLWPGYRSQLESPIADLSNVGSGPYGGAITAALFLREFVARAKTWAHIDLYAWNDADRPGRPKGGEAMSMRALFAMLERRFARA